MSKKKPIDPMPKIKAAIVAAAEDGLCTHCLSVEIIELLMTLAVVDSARALMAFRSGHQDATPEEVLEAIENDPNMRELTLASTRGLVQTYVDEAANETEEKFRGGPEELDPDEEFGPDEEAAKAEAMGLISGLIEQAEAKLGIRTVKKKSRKSRAASHPDKPGESAAGDGSGGSGGTNNGPNGFSQLNAMLRGGPFESGSKRK